MKRGKAMGIFLALVLAVPGFALTHGVFRSCLTWERVMTQAELEESLAQYGLALDCAGGEQAQAVLSACAVLERSEEGERCTTMYTTGFVAEHLNQRGSVEEVFVSEDLNRRGRDNLYVTYSTIDGKQVILHWHVPTGAYDVTVYEEETDTLFQMTEDCGVKYENIRTGIAMGPVRPPCQAAGACAPRCIS